MPLQTGSQLGPYRIVALLGSGGMGAVYRAHDPRLDRDLAVKVLATHLVSSAESVLRFEREAKAASALNHPNILHVYDIGSSVLDGETIHFIAMELVDGETFRVKMKNGADRADALNWLGQVAEALGKAHAAGIIHRDLKPDNIMITVDGYAKVLDFGLAKLTEITPPGSNADEATFIRGPASTPGMVMGTIGYMSPEQAAAREVDERTDIFSFGCILFEVISGVTPFHGDSDIDSLHKLLYSPPAPLDASAAIPPELRHLVDRCLEKDPALRYASMKEVSVELGRVARSGQGSSSGRSLSGTETSPMPSMRSIAILPFDDLSPSKDSEYLGDGFAEEIITDLAKIDSLRVVSRVSAVQFRGTQQPVPAIAKSLNVQYVVTGSVRRAGDRLRIAVQLLDGITDVTLWAEKFNGTMEDIFDIQENVARAIASRLRLTLTTEASGRIRERAIVNVEAYEAYLRARRYTYDYTEESLDAALKEIDRALEIVGQDNVMLLATKATILWQYYNTGVRPDPVYLDRAEEIAETIFQLDPDSPRGHSILGLVKSHRSNQVEAIEHLKRAIAADASDFDSLLWLTCIYTFTGKTEKARPLARTLLALDPLGWLPNTIPAMIEQMDGQFEKALHAGQKAWDMNQARPLKFKVQILALAGNRGEAIALADELLAANPEYLVLNLIGMLRYALEGNGEEVEKLFTREVDSLARGDFQYASWVADVFALLGDSDRAVEWLTIALERGYIPYPYVSAHDLFLEKIRDDPRFKLILERMRQRWVAFDA